MTNRLSHASAETSGGYHLDPEDLHFIAQSASMGHASLNDGDTFREMRR